jgi:hypothetical protein
VGRIILGVCGKMSSIINNIANLTKLYHPSLAALANSVPIQFDNNNNYFTTNMQQYGQRFHPE